MLWLDYVWREKSRSPILSKKNLLAEFGAAWIMERMNLTEDEERNISRRNLISCFVKDKTKDDAQSEM